MKDKTSYNLILLGGTGARCGEIFVYMCANGYFDCDEVHILYIDSDQENGNGEMFRAVVKQYQACRDRYNLKNSPIPYFFRPKIYLTEKTPVGELKHFKDLAAPSQNGVGQVNSAEALMKVLYSDEEMEMKISDGFFAHPNVGAALFAANMDSVMGDFLRIIQAERDTKDVKVFLLGSLFGGTGASAVPTISKYLKKKLHVDSGNKLIDEHLKIGACMVLPYFAFARDGWKAGTLQSNDGDAQIEAEKFATKTKSALEYYKYINSGPDGAVFDRLYILGHDGEDIRGVYATAGGEQRNLPHIVEMYGAMAGVHFFKDDSKSTQHYFATVGKKTIGWGDIYKNTRGFFSFFIMMRFVIVMKSLILEELFDYKQQNKLKKKARNIPWYYDFLNGKAQSVDMQEDQLYHKFEDISNFCDSYIRWFSELSISNVEMLKALNQIRFRESGKEGDVTKGEADVESDVVEYLRLFSEEILIRQHHNNLISLGRGCGKDVMVNAEIYAANVKYIRKHFKTLAPVHPSNNLETERIGMEEIWSRICDLGFKSSTTSDYGPLVENISLANDKSMDACVRNLVNAVFIACMI